MLNYKNVTKNFYKDNKQITAVNNIDLHIQEGEFIVFLGPSGCGKSTTLKMTNRLESISSGHIFYHEKDILDINPVKLRQSMGYVIQDIGLFPNKNIEDNIMLLPKILGWPKEKMRIRAEELMHMMNLCPEQHSRAYPSQLSGGQQQRVGVARALAADPDVLLMDEPFGAIDPINREQIQDEFLSLQTKMNKTILMVSHDLHEAIKMADRIVIFNNGQIVQCDTPGNILTQPKNKFVADFVGADRALKVMGLVKARDAMETNLKNVFSADDKAPTTLKAMEKNKLTYAYIINDGKPVGYVTPKILKYENGLNKDVAEPIPVFSRERHTLREVLSNMLLRDCVDIPVVSETGELKGTICYEAIHNHIVNIYQDTDGSA